MTFHVIEEPYEARRTQARPLECRVGRLMTERAMATDDLRKRLDGYIACMAAHQRERSGGKLLIEARDALERSQVALHHVECGLRAAEEDRDELLARLSALVDRCAYDGVPIDSLPVWQAAHDAVMSRKTPNVPMR